MNTDITALYVCLEEFASMYQEWEKKQLLPSCKQRHRHGRMTLGERLTILIFFYISPCKNFKNYYINYLAKFYKNEFPQLISYSRFIQTMPHLFAPLCVLLHCLKGERTGHYIVDSTHIPVCHNKRINRHKVFKGLAQRGKTTMGWFFGFKLHVVINNKGEVMAIKITGGNVSDRSVLKDLVKNLFGKIYADKGYISKKLFKELWRKGLHIITGIRKNMKNYLMPMIDKINLRKRFKIETFFSQLKEKYNLVHSRHRSQSNFFVHVFAIIAAAQINSRKQNMVELIQN